MLFPRWSILVIILITYCTNIPHYAFLALFANAMCLTGAGASLHLWKGSIIGTSIKSEFWVGGFAPISCLMFTVPPKISPFSTDRTLHLGERASLTCSVTKGDAPLTVTWLKDGKPLDPKHHLAVQQVDQFNSILLIESLSPEHNGNYSCVARNPAAEVVHTQRLVVNGISQN